MLAEQHVHIERDGKNMLKNYKQIKVTFLREKFFILWDILSHQMHHLGNELASTCELARCTCMMAQQCVQIERKAGKH